MYTTYIWTSGILVRYIEQAIQTKITFSVNKNSMLTVFVRLLSSGLKSNKCDSLSALQIIIK